MGFQTMGRFTLFAVALLAAQSDLAAQGLAPAALTAKIDSAAQDWVAKRVVPSVSIAISAKGQIIYSKAFGMADLEQATPARPETVYEIGSITKQFTAAAILGLVEEGKVSLDDRLSKFFPDWPAAGREVTVRQLLNHTSGIKSYTSLDRWRPLMGVALTHDSMVALFRNEPADFAPGSDWRYNNSGYYLLGLIIEKASGQPYGEYVTKRFFQPLGLKSTSYCGTNAIVPNRADGYSPSPDGIVNAAPLYVDQAFSAGALCSTTGDLIAWTRALESGKVIKPSSYQAMTTPIPLPGGKKQTYGFGLGVADQAGHRVVTHSGGINGFNSVMASYQNDSVIVAVLVNQDGGAGKIAKQIASWAIGLPDTPDNP